MKLKRRKDPTHTPERPRWIWQLVWKDPRTRRETAERIGYYCLARDRWRPPGGRLERLTEQEANSQRRKKQIEQREIKAGMIVPMAAETRERFRSFCDAHGQPPGLAFERMMQMVTSGAYGGFAGACRKMGCDERGQLERLLQDWVDRQTSNPPASWAALIAWWKQHGSPNAGSRTKSDAETTFKLFETLCPQAAAGWQELDTHGARAFQVAVAAKWRPATVVKHLANLRLLWNACNPAWVRGNPWSKLKRPKLGSNPEGWHYFTHQEVGRLIAQANPRWQARIRLAWKAGLRPGEIDHLRKEDVDWKGQRVQIREHVASSQVIGWRPKDKDARSIPIDPETLTALQKLKAKAGRNPYLFIAARRRKQALARQAAGKWRGQDQLASCKQKPWGRILRLAEISIDSEGREFYALRKTCCCNLLIDGVPTNEVQALMGHADIKTTLTWYSKVNKADAERRIRAAQSRSG